MIAYKYRSGRGTKDDKGRDIFERDIKLLSHDTIYIPTIEQLNDPTEALVDDRIFEMQLEVFRKLGAKDSINMVRERYISFYESIVRDSGIYSLSKKIDNELMWAYYASGHSGYAIIFDTDVLARSFGNGKWGGMYEIDVNYSKKLPKFDISRLRRENDVTVALSCLVGNKSEAWEHEDEHRLVFDKGGKSLTIDYRAVKGFVFGCRMKDEDVDYVMKLFAGRDLDYYKIVLKDNTYKLLLLELKDRYPDADKYCPYKVEYDIDRLIESDRDSFGVGYKYRPFVEEAMSEVSKEPFLTGISHIVVTDDGKYPHILVWTKVNQDGYVSSMKSFEYDIIKGKLVRK
ncbi:DUF2971 domain-containing protein [Prevotella communis]|uniref:DUF2971 domain-containing protein n=1 Tax=Prevotella communis TaxID=2913614 RepID=UPI001EDBA0BE|nr:DUF2971 domain-containing protein [Prevotella communis]UKK56902.1 DUF2971 domain-containing protein [Prevotella communis]